MIRLASAAALAALVSTAATAQSPNAPMTQPAPKAPMTRSAPSQMIASTPLHGDDTGRGYDCDYLLQAECQRSDRP